MKPHHRSITTYLAGAAFALAACACAESTPQVVSAPPNSGWCEQHDSFAAGCTPSVDRSTPTTITAAAEPTSGGKYKSSEARLTSAQVARREPSPAPVRMPTPRPHPTRR